MRGEAYVYVRRLFRHVQKEKFRAVGQMGTFGRVQFKTFECLLEAPNRTKKRSSVRLARWVLGLVQFKTFECALEAPNCTVRIKE
jgi:hypothetical protein